jgi:predicted nuclease of predicted toxin-antitoxin system
LRLQDFAFLTDVNLHPDLVAALRRLGFDILDVKESGLAGSSDLAILRLAYSQERVVLTHDSDFGQLAVAALEPILGIVYLRPGHFDPSFTLATLETLFEEVEDLAPPFILVAERTASRVKIRLRRF